MIVNEDLKKTINESGFRLFEIAKEAKKGLYTLECWIDDPDLTSHKREVILEGLEKCKAEEKKQNEIIEFNRKHFGWEG